MWKDVPGYENRYEASVDGYVRNKNTKKVLKYVKDKYGYCYVTLCNGVKNKKLLVHRVIAITFIEQSSDKPCVNHIDGNKENNAVNNLEWCSFSENARHAYKNKLLVPYERSGSNHPQVKITMELCKRVKEFLANGHKSEEAIKHFKLSAGTISKIKNDKTYLGVVM